MASNPPLDLVLTPLYGAGKTVPEWLTNFHLLLILIDPYTDEAAWIFPIARRVINTFGQADCRVAWVVTADADDARTFLGPWAQTVLTFPDPDRVIVKALGLERLPALVDLALDGTIVDSTEGWHPATWRRVTDTLAKIMSWSEPVFGLPKDPGPFEGTPALA